jgi:hypothetical protein
LRERKNCKMPDIALFCNYSCSVATDMLGLYCSVNRQDMKLDLCRRNTFHLCLLTAYRAAGLHGNRLQDNIEMDIKERVLMITLNENNILNTSSQYRQSHSRYLVDQYIAQLIQV